MGSILGDVGAGAATGAAFGPVGIGVGALAGVAKYFLGKKQDNLANKINPNFVPYQENPLAKQQLGIAQQFLNGRMAGAGMLEQNIANSQANQMSNISRNASDSSTALALGAAAQGQANNAYGNLQTKEAQNKYNLLDNLNAAYATNIREGDKVHQSQMDKFGIDTNEKSQLRSAGVQNQFGALNDLSSLGILAGQYYGFGNRNQNSNNNPNLGRTGGLSVTGYNPNQIY